MSIKIIKLVIKIENVFCVYRNYYMFSRKNRILTNIRMLLELFLIMTWLILNVYIFQIESRAKLASFILNTINAIIILLSARFYARSFKKLIACMNANDCEFSSDADYINALERRHKILKRVLTYYGIFDCFFFIILPVLCYKQLTIYDILYQIHIFLRNATYIFEYVVMYSILTTLTEHVRCIIRSIDAKVKILERDQRNSPEPCASANVELGCYKKWTVAYTNIKECSNLFNSIFGVQMTVIQLTVMLYVVIFLYKVTYFIIAETSGIVISIFFYCVMLIFYIVALFMLTHSAYGLQVSGDRLRCQLAKLLIHCPIHHVSYKATKDLLGLVATRGLRTRAFGGLPIDMTLLPSSVMFFTTYTVIALQFNNVV